MLFMKQPVENIKKKVEVENLNSESTSEEIIKKELDELITNITENVLGSTTHNSFVQEILELQLKTEKMNKRLKKFMIFNGVCVLAILGIALYILNFML